MTIYTSNAILHYVIGEHPKDVQILVENPELFNVLPGKYERLGVKTLTSWPFFVTAYLQHAQCTDLSRRRDKLAVRESASTYQLPIFDLTAVSKSSKAQQRKVERALSEIRKLHEDLNAALYSHPTERPQIHAPSDAYDLLAPFLAALDHEELWVVNLDTRNRVMNLTKLYQGSVNMSQVRVGEVFRKAITENSPALIVAHNHPSGDPNPSPDDVAVTRAIVQAGKLLDIDVLDHIVVGAGRFVSLKERGLGFGG